MKNKDKNAILERIRSLILKADSMDEEFREALFKKVVSEYVELYLIKSLAA